MTLAVWPGLELPREIAALASAAPPSRGQCGIQTSTHPRQERSMTRQRILVIAFLLTCATLISTRSHAGGINLSWSDCGVAGREHLSFACNANAFSGVLMVSVVPDAPMVALGGAETELLVSTASSILPSWWQMQPGGCRPNGFSTSSDFGGGPSTCVDPWQSNAINAHSFEYPVPGFSLNQARIRTIQSVPPGLESAVDAVSEIYVLRLHINNSRSHGVGSCPGFCEGACIVLNSVNLLAPGGVVVQSITAPLLRQQVLWQDGGSVTGGCPGATHSRRSTWSSIKSLYR